MIKTGIKSPCTGDISVKEIIYFLTILFAFAFNCALIYYQVRDLPENIKSNTEKIEKNTENIGTIKTDIGKISTKVDLIYDAVVK